MGGSSLAPDVLHRTFGSGDGWLDLRVLDSTDPAAVAASVDDLDPLATLWIVASKSGTTTEPLAFQADAWDRAERALRAHHAPRREHAAELMVAITDPGRSVEAIPHHDELREVFLNPPDIGGRYSALTYVGLVPASLIGLDLDALLASALAMAGACREPDPESNPGVSLGLAIGTLAKAGRDKLTFVADPAIDSFGAWAEQLIAESTGKHGTGIVPVDREPLGPVESYGPDRVFVRLTLDDGARWAAGDALVDAAAAAGHPVIRIEIADPIDVGAEIFRWEVATAIAGAVLGIDPFDQPNVEEAKDLTRKVLAAAEGGAKPAPAPPALVADGDTGLTLHGDAALRLTAGDGTVVGELARHLARRKPNAYLALQAFIAPTPAAEAALDRIRALLRDATRCATTAGYGPRFLHSTGQLHKGGPPTGWFLQLTSDHPRRSADRRLAVHVRAPDRCPGRRRLRRDRVARAADPPRPPRRSRSRAACPRDGAARGARARLTEEPTRPVRVVATTREGQSQCGSGSSVSVGWAPTWSAACSRTATRSSPTTARRRRPRRSRARARSARTRSRSWSASSRSRELSGSWSRPATRPRPRSQELMEHLEPGDTIIDGGNTNFHDDQRRHAALAERGVQYVDAGTSGGIWGLQVGYCLMVGGDEAAVKPLEPIFVSLAPEGGYLHVGGAGAGHYVKMVHNGIEYGLMQAYAEGFEIMHASSYPLELGAIAELWMQGSVVRSWLLELAARAFKANGPDLEHIKGYVADSGEGRWTIQEAIDHDVPAPVITLSLITRFRSRQDDSYGAKVLAALRNEFGGHAVKTE